MASITYENVTKVFGPSGQTSAIKDLSLEIEDGEFMVLVGPSGCGKSTALRLLAGLERITSGHIYIGDRRVDNVQAKDRDLAMVFQSYALYPHMRVQDNIAFGLRLHKVPKEESERRVQETAELLGLLDLLDRRPGQLSGGQRQRVALGRAIVREPAAFLLDEPLSNLDAKLRVQTRAELAKLYQRLGTTFVYVTHDQVEAMTMATRIAVLDRGSLQQVGTPEELYDTPANLFVAGFIGSPAMNFFDAAIVRDDGDGVAVQIGAQRLTATRELVAALKASSPQRIIMGIRPEHIHHADYLPRGIQPEYVDTTVDVVEAMGSDTFLHLDFAGTSLVARVDPRSKVKQGETFRAAFDVSQMKAFDVESGRALYPPTQ